MVRLLVATCAHVIKFNSMSCVSFPPKLLHCFLQKLTEDVALLGNSPTAEIIRVLLSCDGKKQSDAIKKLSANFDSFIDDSHTDLLLGVLANGLFYCIESRIIRVAICGVFRRLPDETCRPVLRIIRNQLELLQDAEDISGIEVVESLVQTDFGKQFVRDNDSVLVSLLKAKLDWLNTLLTKSQTTIEVSSRHVQLHLAVRTGLSIVRLSDRQNCERMGQLIKSVIGSLGIKGIPLEVQVNCCKIIVMIISARDSGVDAFIGKLSGCSSGLGELDGIDSSFTMSLNICCALLSTLQREILIGEIKNHGTLIGGLILGTIFKTADKLHDPALAILSCRTLQSWCEKMLSTLRATPQSELVRQECSQAYSRLLELILNSMEHTVDTVRYSAKDAFGLYLQIYQTLEYELHDVVRLVLGMPIYKKSKYISLACLAKNQLAGIVMEEQPDLVEELLEAAKDPSLCNHAKEAFTTLMTDSLKRNAGAMNAWVYPLLNAIGDHPEGSTLQSCLFDVIQLDANLLRGLDPWFQADPQRLSVYMTVLLTVRKMGLGHAETEAHSPDLWNGFVRHSVMDQALHHSDGKLRLTALGVVIEGMKSTQLYSQLELDWVRRFLSHNLGYPNAAFCQQLCSYIKKFLLKLRNGGLPLIRKKQQQERVQSYKQFLNWLISKCISALRPDCAFWRLYSSLQILTLIDEIFVLLADDCAPDWGLNAMFDKSVLWSLVDCLFDSFDSNQQMALRLLKTPQFLRLADEDVAELKVYYELSFELAQSVRPSDAIAAAFLFRWMSGLRSLDQVEMMMQSKTSCWSHQSNCTFRLLQRLIQLLADHAESAERDVLRAALETPIYGVLLCIRSLVMDQKRDGADETRDAAWDALIVDIVKMCLRSSFIVSPIVCNESPEGFLPESINSSGGKSLSRTACGQALLVCAWRTVKEVSLFFGEISGWLTQRIDACMADTLSEMGNHLKQLLLETIHRGAFEQVYCGFSMLCTSLWSCPSPQLQQMPSCWLAGLIDDLAGRQPAGKLCATRRSAGLPFMVQAILSSEVELGHETLLNGCMESILTIAATGTSECRVHCLNVLRALYRESRLSQVIGTFVSRGLVLAIQGFEASHWPERNSSTLLFSALMTRVFGVARSRTDVQKKNTLTGRVFFQMYRQLYTFLLDKLASAAENMHCASQSLQPCLYPILMLLARLNSPTCHANDSLFQLEPFVRLVRLCGSCSVLKTRQLAAQALVPLVTSDDSVDLIRQLFDGACQCRSHNALHGTLLQIRHLALELSPSSNAYKTACVIFADQLPRLAHLLEGDCWVVKHEYAATLQDLIVMPMVDFQEVFLERVLRSCLDHLNMPLRKQPFHVLFCKKAVQLYCAVRRRQPGIELRGSDGDELISFLNHPLYEVRLEILEQLRNNKYCHSVSLSAIDPVVNDLDPDCQVLAISLLASQPQLDGPLNAPFFLDVYSRTINEKVGCAALLAAATLFAADHEQAYHTSSVHDLVVWSTSLLKMADPRGTCRHYSTVAQCLVTCYRILGGSKHCIGELGIVLSNLWTCLFRCLTDNDEDVRDLASTAVGLIAKSEMFPAMAMKWALEYFLVNIGSVYPLETAFVLLVLATNRQEIVLSESPAFEKVDSDCYDEDFIYGRLYCKYLRRCLSKHGLSDGEDAAKALASSIYPQVLGAPCEQLPTCGRDLLKDVFMHRWKTLETRDLSDRRTLLLQRRHVHDYVLALIKLLHVSDSLEITSEIRQQIINDLSSLSTYFASRILRFSREMCHQGTM